MQHSWKVFRWEPVYRQGGEIKQSRLNIGVGDFVNIVIAEKGQTSTDDKTPIQSHYRLFQNDPSNAIYVEKFEMFAKSGRRRYEFPKAATPRLMPDHSPETPSPSNRLPFWKHMLLNLFALLGSLLRSDRQIDGSAARKPSTSSLQGKAYYYLGVLPDR
jgi:hypothetical protein